MRSYACWARLLWLRRCASCTARLELSRAKHRSLAGHARWSRRLAALVPFYEYDEAQFFRADDAPDGVAARRRAGFMRLAGAVRAALSRRPPASRPRSRAASPTCSSPSRYRVPFQFSRFVRQHFKRGSFVAVVGGRRRVTDLDGNRFYDLTGSYGVNVFGYDFYKDCIERGSERVARSRARCSAPIIR